MRTVCTVSVRRKCVTSGYGAMSRIRMEKENDIIALRLVRRA